METRDWLKVRQLAEQVRKAAEEEVGEVYGSSLSGACALASLILDEMLWKNGVKSQFVMGQFCLKDQFEHDHCWVLIGDRVVDVTATQFIWKDGHDLRYFAPVHMQNRLHREPEYRAIKYNDQAIREVTTEWCMGWSDEELRLIQRMLGRPWVDELRRGIRRREECQSGFPRWSTPSF